MRRPIVPVLLFVLQFAALQVPLAAAAEEPADASAEKFLEWKALPDLPDSLGLGGPLVGVHNDALIVAGGSNFPVSEGDDLWEVPKKWHDEAWVLVREGDGEYRWLGPFKLERPVAYGACVNTPQGVACLGGSDGQRALADCFLLQWNAEKKSLVQVPLPSLPEPSVYGAAAIIDQVMYLAGGQTGMELASATTSFQRLDLSQLSPAAAEPAKASWEKLPAWPGPTRAFNLTVAQHNGFDDCIYVISGRRQDAEVPGVEGIRFLQDVYEFDPMRYDAEAFDANKAEYAGTGHYTSPWRRRADVPRCVMAGTAAAVGQSHIFVLSGADGRLMDKADELKDDHPGFPKKALAFHTITDRWIDAGDIPANQVTTPATTWGDAIIVASGEVRPRVRTRAVWAIRPVKKERSFGVVNFTVLAIYLLAMVGVGVYFARRNRNTEDYFRGGQRIAWWAAGCSIFATMLSSITFMAIPAKAFAQDLVYLMGNMMILAVAPIAVYLALPFFRRIDATSAYEYLELRFNRAVRLLASGLFIVFHIFRMGIVMSLAALALATVTPLTPVQCVLAMGALSIVYCTLGGVEAVVWTDTIQTFVLLGGGLLCFGLMLAGTEGGLGESLQISADAGKLQWANWNWDATSASVALWFIVFGALGQNISTYTADQAVVQRYMTTPDERRAGRAIWTAALLSVPASFLFYFMGTGLWMFYRSNPERLDPTFTTDQIFPLFIAEEVPVGIAGLIVAGIFAAAQSTISTSMNSTATAVVTDFMRPFRLAKTENGYLNWARGLTFLLGLAGTLLGLLFVNPDIKSLFDEFLGMVGLFMGALGGLFALGIMTRRTTGVGALAGVVGGTAVVLSVKLFTQIHVCLYALISITACCMIGYIVSLLTDEPSRNLSGLTIHDRHD